MFPSITTLPNEVHRHRGKLAAMFPEARLPAARKLPRNPLAIYALTYRAASRKTMQRLVRIILEVIADGPVNPFEFPWWEVTYEQAVALKASLIRRYSGTYVCECLGVLRGVMKECWRLRLIGWEDYLRVVSVENVRRDRRRPVRLVSDQGPAQC